MSTTSQGVDGRYCDVTAEELGDSLTGGNENYLFICITPVLLTHLVLNLEHLERHTPS